jgi:tetratricopeptide (TPR) repeat protein
MSEPTRIEMLQQFLAENPGDAFARYGLAMEYAKLGQIESALAEYKKLLELNPDYTAGYQMAAQMLAAAGRTDEARAMFAGGIAAAQRAGNVHARTEMEAMLAELG